MGRIRFRQNQRSSSDPLRAAFTKVVVPVICRIASNHFTPHSFRATLASMGIVDGEFSAEKLGKKWGSLAPSTIASG